MPEAGTPIGTILDSTEVEKGDYKYRGHIVAGSKEGKRDTVLIYSCVPARKSCHKSEIVFMCPGHIPSDIREQIDTVLLSKWKDARLPDRSLEAKELGIKAFDLPPRSTPYHHAA